MLDVRSGSRHTTVVIEDGGSALQCKLPRGGPGFDVYTPCGMGANSVSSTLMDVSGYVAIGRSGSARRAASSSATKPQVLLRPIGALGSQLATRTSPAHASICLALAYLRTLHRTNVNGTYHTTLCSHSARLARILHRHTRLQATRLTAVISDSFAQKTATCRSKDTRRGRRMCPRPFGSSPKVITGLTTIQRSPPATPFPDSHPARKECFPRRLGLCLTLVNLPNPADAAVRCLCFPVPFPDRHPLLVLSPSLVVPPPPRHRTVLGISSVHSCPQVSHMRGVKGHRVSNKDIRTNGACQTKHLPTQHSTAATASRSCSLVS